MKSKFSIAMFFSLFLMGISEGEPREITHEDIKDAMLSLVHMMRDNTEKLERHEARDRQTAEQIKKAMSLLTKRMSTVDGLKAYLVKLDERVTGIEQLITQRDESERIQIQKTAETLEDLESRLEGWATEIETKVVEGASRAMPKIPTPPADRSPEILLRIQATEAKLADELDKLRNSLNSSILNTTSVSNEEVLGNVLTELKDMAKQIKDASRVLAKLEEAVEAAEAAAATRAAEFTPKPNSSPLQEQNVKLALLQDLLHSILEQIRDLPRVSVLQTIHNETQMTLQNTGHAVEEAIVQGIKDIAFKITENKEDARNSMTLLRSDLASDAERIKQELQDLSKGQSVMVEMADHVLDTKKRLEYASKIMREVSELVMSQGLDINNTLNTRFDGISNDIMDNQNGALANLTVKMEQEMNQVWRQINVMYQQMTESAKALDKLHKQNEVYVNGTTSTMDGMESKVGEITKRMSEVDTNLNYLLGRLSLVTQEFNQIKQGLGAALDNIKASFKEVQSKANDLSNPGPHPVPQHYKELESRSESVVNIPSS